MSKNRNKESDAEPKRAKTPAGKKPMTAKSKENSGSSRRWTSDARIPCVGTKLKREVRSQKDGKPISCVVTVRADGFEMGGELFRSLTDAATTFMRAKAGGSAGTRRSGFEFFGLGEARA